MQTVTLVIAIVALLAAGFAVYGLLTLKKKLPTSIQGAIKDAVGAVQQTAAKAAAKL